MRRQGRYPKVPSVLLLTHSLALKRPRYLVAKREIHRCMSFSRLIMMLAEVHNSPVPDLSEPDAPGCWDDSPTRLVREEMMECMPGLL